MTILKYQIIFLLFILSISCSDSNSENPDSSNQNPTSPPANEYSAIFGGGPFYSGGDEVIDDLKLSGFSTVILWTIHVGEDGSMNFNDQKIINANGEYIGDPEWSNRLVSLLETPTSVDRIEVGVGAWGAQSWENIKNRIENEGTGKETKLYKSFLKLMEITGATAINFDDEVTYDVASTVQFSLMLADMGYKIGLCPFDQINYWKLVYEQVNAQKPETIDRVYLQCYAGGYSNKPVNWNRHFENLKVSMGLWCRNGNNCMNGDSPKGIQSKIENDAENISGGFLWLYDDIQKCAAYGSSSSYARAINEGLK